MLQRSLSGLAQSSNRFVRFGYRRPPPWPKPNPNLPPQLDADASTIDRNLLADLSQHYSSWPQLSNVTIPLVKVPSPQDPSLVPVLAHGTEIVLQGDGVYPLEAPWLISKHPASRYSRPRNVPVYYTESLRKIVQPGNIAWQNIPGYIPACKDSTLHHIASRTPGVLYTSSTSSMTPTITALYHLISNFRDTDLLGGLSPQISDLPSNFSKMHRRPTAFILSRNKEGSTVYSVNAHSGIDPGPSILRDLGHSMERMLTTAPDDFFDKYVLPANESLAANTSANIDKVPQSQDMQYYHYSKLSSFLLRAQIDCRNETTGEVFDVKTRAVAPIRYDLSNYESFTSHKLQFLHGKHNSYEREFYDMVRTVFLKYALQLRIGRMAGAFVAYHNTSEILGLEYIPLEEIHSYIFGGERWADISFGTAIKLLEEILGTVSSAMKLEDAEDKIKVVLTTDWSRLRMHIFAQVLRKGEVDQFGPSSFMDEREEEDGEIVSGVVDHLAGQGQWHHDSHLHGVKHRGVSVIGNHDSIKALGGEQVSISHRENQPRKRGTTNELDLNYTKFDFSNMTADRLGVWELNVAPLINGKLAPKSTIYLGDDDCYSLKYSLQRIERLSNSHYANFVTSLGRIYVR